jgi:hypothetical protein
VDRLLTSAPIKCRLRSRTHRLDAHALSRARGTRGVMATRVSGQAVRPRARPGSAGSRGT